MKNESTDQYVSEALNSAQYLVCFLAVMLASFVGMCVCQCAEPVPACMCMFSVYDPDTCLFAVKSCVFEYVKKQT